MSEFENIQRLMRLKRYEQPGEGFENFTEDFLHQFHHRQRAEMLRKSSLVLLWERTSTWWNNLLAPKWTLAAAAVAVCAVGAWLITGEKAAPAITNVPAVPVVNEKPFVPKMDLSDLPMVNMAERNNAKLEESLIRKHLEIRPAIEGQVSVSPLPATGWQDKSSSKNAVPANAAGTDTQPPAKQ